MLWVTFYLFLLLWGLKNSSLKPAWSQKQQDTREASASFGTGGLMLSRSIQLSLGMPRACSSSLASRVRAAAPNPSLALLAGGDSHKPRQELL